MSGTQSNADPLQECVDLMKTPQFQQELLGLIRRYEKDEHMSRQRLAVETLRVAEHCIDQVLGYPGAYLEVFQRLIDEAEVKDTHAEARRS